MTIQAVWFFVLAKSAGLSAIEEKLDSFCGFFLSGRTNWAWKKMSSWYLWHHPTSHVQKQCKGSFYLSSLCSWWWWMKTFLNPHPILSKDMATQSFSLESGFLDFNVYVMWHTLRLFLHVSNIFHCNRLYCC